MRLTIGSSSGPMGKKADPYYAIALHRGNFPRSGFMRIVAAGLELGDDETRVRQAAGIFAFQAADCAAEVLARGAAALAEEGWKTGILASGELAILLTPHGLELEALVSYAEYPEEAWDGEPENDDHWVFRVTEESSPHDLYPTLLDSARPDRAPILLPLSLPSDPRVPD